MEKRNANQPYSLTNTFYKERTTCIALFKAASCEAALKIRILKICANSNRRYDVSRSANPFIWQRLKTSPTVESCNSFLRESQAGSKRGKRDSTPSQRAAFPSFESVRCGRYWGCLTLCWRCVFGTRGASARLSALYYRLPTGCGTSAFPYGCSHNYV